MFTSAFKIVYVASPYHGNFLQRWKNIRYARRACKAIYEAGMLPIAPHLLFPQFLPEAERRRVTECIIPICAELWVFYDRGISVSEGMMEEIKAFRALSRPVIIVSLRDFPNFVKWKNMRENGSRTPHAG